MSSMAEIAITLIMIRIFGLNVGDAFVEHEILLRGWSSNVLRWREGQERMWMWHSEVSGRFDVSSTFMTPFTKTALKKSGTAANNHRSLLPCDNDPTKPTKARII